MPAPKIVDTEEVKRWMREGKTYGWMVETYRDKYNVETTISMWGNIRRRLGIDPRITRDEDLIPWKVNSEHQNKYALSMLRYEARRREGNSVIERYANKLNLWLEYLQTEGLVVHYDPDTEDGFHYVPARPDIDTDLVRVPDKRTGRPAAE